MKNKDKLTQTRQYQDVEETLRYVKMPLNTCTKYDLSPVRAMIYEIIKNFCKLKNKMFTGTALTLQVYCNVSRRTVTRTLSELVRRGLIEKVDSDKNYPYYVATKKPPKTVCKSTSNLQQRRINEVQESLRYLKMPLNICTKYDLSPTEAMIFQVINESKSLKDGVFKGSTLSLRTFFRVSRGTVNNALEELLKRNFITKIKTDTNRPFYATLRGTEKDLRQEIKRFNKNQKRKKVSFSNERVYTEAELNSIIDDIDTIQV